MASMAQAAAAAPAIAARRAVRGTALRGKSAAVKPTRSGRGASLECNAFLDQLKKAAEAGVTIVFGTDAGSPAVGHEVVAPEMKFMVKVGVVPDAYAAIRSATVRAAELSKLEAKLGTLEAGKLADVIVVRGNPLADLDALEHVALTFVGGVPRYVAA